MKKIILAFFLVLAGINVFAQSGKIRELSGTVELKPAGVLSFVPASAGDLVREDTVISTGFKSTALVEVGSVLIAVRPLTRLTLTEIRSSAGNETLNVNLQAGRVRVDVAPPAGTKAAMSVTSPSATASVRGTEYETDGVNLNVYRGRVVYQGNRGNRFTVVADANSSIGKNGKGVDPVGLGSSTLKPRNPVGTETQTKPVNVGTKNESETPSKPDPNPNPEPTPKPPSGGSTPPSGGGSTPQTPGGGNGEVGIDITYS